MTALPKQRYFSERQNRPLRLEERAHVGRGDPENVVRPPWSAYAIVCLQVMAERH